MKKKSRFQEMMEAAKDTVIPQKVEKVTPAIPESELVALLHPEYKDDVIPDENPTEVVKKEVEDLGQYATKEQKESAEKVYLDVMHKGMHRAYNIWYNKDAKCYMKDTLIYEGEILHKLTSEKLTNSQALAMAEVTKVFGEKLILKKKGV